VRPGEDELRAAFAEFRAAGVTQLVIDLRYNGGGLLSTAAVLGSLIDQNGAGQPLIVETYNNLHQDMNRHRLMFTEAQAVDIQRVVFLTTGRTASASEQVINGLAPYLDVKVVGSRTLGKPVGADSWTHCDYAIAPITFHSLNAAGQGDYFDGIEPECEVPDDLLHELGDPDEAQLHAALRLLNGDSCFEGEGTAPESAFPGASQPDASAPAPRSSRLRPASLPRSTPAQTLPAGPIPDLPGWY
jgi:C-terminal processing protease CtpA/Prc